jgi:HEAT repeat protein
VGSFFNPQRFDPPTVFSITALAFVQLRRPSFILAGVIRFGFHGDNEEELGIREAARDYNAVLFDRSQYNEFQTLKSELDRKLAAPVTLAPRPVVLACPSCHKQSHVPNEVGTQYNRCPHCESPFTAPEPVHTGISASKAGQSPPKTSQRTSTPRAILLACCVLTVVLLHAKPWHTPDATDVERERQRLKSDGPATRAAAAQSLGKMGPIAKDAVPDLVETATAGWLSEYGNASAAATEALTKIGPPGVPLLAAIVSHDADHRKQDRALDALGRIGPAAKVAVPAIVAALADEGSWEAVPSMQILVKHRAAVTLAAVAPDHPKAVPALIEALDYNGLTRYIAVEALGKLGPRAKAALPALRQIADGSLRLRYPYLNQPLAQQDRDNDSQDAIDTMRRIGESP